MSLADFIGCLEKIIFINLTRKFINKNVFLFDKEKVTLISFMEL